LIAKLRRLNHLLLLNFLIHVVLAFIAKRCNLRKLIYLAAILRKIGASFLLKKVNRLIHSQGLLFWRFTGHCPGCSPANVFHFSLLRCLLRSQDRKVSSLLL